MNFHIDPNIAKAKTIDKAFYFDSKIWEASKEKIFAGSWQCMGDVNTLFKAGVRYRPAVFMDNYIEEPLLLTKAGDEIKVFSNVCTHRGFILAHHPSESKNLTCKYHGRRFDLGGKCLHMPEFEGVEGFPSACDHLTELQSVVWNQFLFVSLAPKVDIKKSFNKIEERISFLNTSSFTPGLKFDKVYSVHAHWALYCENFMEGFHIPFVHQDLNAMIDYGTYKTICEDEVILQIAYADNDAEAFDLPDGHPDFGKHVVAYYYWLSPNLMLNYYKWGLQLNYIMPVSKKLTKVHFKYYFKDLNDARFLDGDKLGEKTEREDEFVVEGVQQGLQSRFYSHGRYSVKRENGVHHFHQLMANYLS